ncbi:MAG: lysophospholipid acyltransferase family protein [Candidatus Riflebacteria bacterium]|nr:lysophospholipid acyltransferase family protein [Candidatus Riflebacteria bacterium]
MKTTCKKLVHGIEAFFIEKIISSSLKINERQKRLISSGLKKIAFDILGFRKEYVVKSISDRLEVPLSKATDIAGKAYFHFFNNCMTMISLSLGKPEALLSSIKITGFDYFKEAYSRNSGVIILSGHYGLWELIPHFFSLNGYKMTSVVRRQSNQHVDIIMENMRKAHGASTTDSGFNMRQSLKDLRNGNLLGLMIDQNAGDKGIFIDFLGKPASTVPGPAILSEKTEAPLVLAIVRPSQNALHKHEVEFFPPFYPENYFNSSNGRFELTARYSDLFCSIIKKNPEQWFWLHRRWKSNNTFSSL